MQEVTHDDQDVLNTRHEGLVETGAPSWGDDFRPHVEALIRKIENGADTYQAALMTMLGGGLSVELFGGKGFSLRFDSDGLPVVSREKPSRPASGSPGLWLRCEEWALDALLDPSDEIDDDPEFFIAAGFEMEGDFELLNRLDRLDGGGQSALGLRASLKGAR